MFLLGQFLLQINIKILISVKGKSMNLLAHGVDGLLKRYIQI